MDYDRRSDEVSEFRLGLAFWVPCLEVEVVLEESERKSIAEALVSMALLHGFAWEKWTRRRCCSHLESVWMCCLLVTRHLGHVRKVVMRAPFFLTCIEDHTK